MTEKSISQLMKEHNQACRKAELNKPEPKPFFNFSMQKWKNFEAGTDGRTVIDTTK